MSYNQKTSSACTRLLKRLRLLGFPLTEELGTYSIQRTYAGHWQRKAGQWVWFLAQNRSNGPFCMNIGGQDPLTDCLKAKALHLSETKFGEWHVDIEPKLEKDTIRRFKDRWTHHP